MINNANKDSVLAKKIKAICQKILPKAKKEEKWHLNNLHQVLRSFFHFLKSFGFFSKSLVTIRSKIGTRIFLT